MKIRRFYVGKVFVTLKHLPLNFILTFDEPQSKRFLNIFENLLNCIFYSCTTKFFTKVLGNWFKIPIKYCKILLNNFFRSWLHGTSTYNTRKRRVYFTFDCETFLIDMFQVITHQLFCFIIRKKKLNNILLQCNFSITKILNPFRRFSLKIKRDNPCS